MQLTVHENQNNLEYKLEKNKLLSFQLSMQGPLITNQT